MREHIPSYQLHMGQRAFVVPRDDSTPRGPTLGMIPTSGMELSVNDYIFGCVQRGAVLAYPVEAPAAEPEAKAVAELATEQVAELAAEQVHAPAPEPAAEKEGV